MSPVLAEVQAEVQALDSRLREAAERFATPAYLYATDVIEARLADLRQHFGRWFAVSFAVKSNPNPALLGWMRDRLDYLDISSGGTGAEPAGRMGPRADQLYRPRQARA